ncbi:TPM domain-containing protein [Lacticaseibacillus chiayiensis]|uniref:TPM domain-containing protein n=1 Tax=Lacticaseibacillus chiayiensis TaxID=2100821 RepID=UPI003C718249
MRRNWWLVPFLLLLGFGFATLQSVQAASGKWYRDQGAMMGPESRKVLQQLNNQTFAKVKGHPQIAVMTVASLHDDDIEDYANDQFAKAGIGKKDWENGLLLVLSRNDHKYWLEVGYGLEDVVPDGSADEIVTDSVKKQLKAENYDRAIAMLLTNIGKRVVAKQSAITTPTQIKAKRAQDAAVKQALVVAALVLGGLMVVFFLVRAAMNARLHNAMSDPGAMAALPIYAAVTATGMKLRVDAASLPLFRFAWSHDKLRGIGMAGLVRRRFESLAREIRFMAPHPYWYYNDLHNALRQLSDHDIVNAPTVTALAELLTPALQDRLTAGQPYEKAYATWLSEQKHITSQEAATVWTEFLKNVKPTDQFSEKTLAATLSVILFHVRHPDKDQHLNQDDLPLWVMSDFGSGSSSDGGSGGSDNFGSGFGGGSSGGGGFGGSW